MAEDNTHKTMTEKLKAKRKPGRPPGTRNKVTAKRAVESCFNTGMSLSQLKQVLDHYIEHADDYGLTVKDILSYVKTEFDLMKFCYDVLDKDENNTLSKGQTQDIEGKVGDKVVAFSLKASN